MTVGLTNVFQQTEGFLLIKWVHNDFMYVRSGGMRNTKTWSKSSKEVINLLNYLGIQNFMSGFNGI